jgi:hypothetical protein
VCKIFLQDFFLAHWKREQLISKQLAERWEQQQQQTRTLLQRPVDSELHILTYNNNAEIGTQQKTDSCWEWNAWDSIDWIKTKIFRDLSRETALETICNSPFSGRFNIPEQQNEYFGWRIHGLEKSKWAFWDMHVHGFFAKAHSKSLALTDLLLKVCVCMVIIF